MTEAQLGVSVSLPLNYTNIDIIIKLIDIDNIKLCISGLFDEPDEVIPSNYDDIFDIDILDELVDLENEDEFQKKYSELDIKEELTFNFIYICAGIYARNLSYRSNPYLFKEDDMTPTQLIEHIQKGVEIFRECGISEEIIKIGNTMSDG